MSNLSIDLFFGEVMGSPVTPEALVVIRGSVTTGNKDQFVPSPWIEQVLNILFKDKHNEQYKIFSIFFQYFNYFIYTYIFFFYFSNSLL